jgi:hypothetical protein
MGRWSPCRARSVCALADAKAILLRCLERTSPQHWDLKSAAAESQHDARFPTKITLIFGFLDKGVCVASNLGSACHFLIVSQAIRDVTISLVRCSRALSYCQAALCLATHLVERTLLTTLRLDRVERPLCTLRLLTD